MATQFLRTSNLYLVNDTEALDLSNMRMRFQITASDVETPNVARIRVYNLGKETTAKAISEFSSVVLNAGYGSQPGTIFTGTIKQFRQGKERNIDRFLDIFAADGDLAHNFGVVNTSLPAGSTQQTQLQTLANAMNVPGGQSISLDPNATKSLTPGGILPQPRGKVFLGLARTYMRNLSSTYNARWSIQNGKLTVIPLNGYLPGEAVVINSTTGMIGQPVATEQGIEVVCLLNPQIKIGQRIQLNNADITQTTIKQQFFPGYQDFNLIATVDTTTDGIYRAIVVEHEGDTRGEEWYSHLTCLLLDKSSGIVFPFGIATNP